MQNSQENTSAGVSIKKKLRHRCFLLNFAKFSKTSFWISFFFYYYYFFQSSFFSKSLSTICKNIILKNISLSFFFFIIIIIFFRAVFFLNLSVLFVKALRKKLVQYLSFHKAADTLMNIIGVLLVFGHWCIIC